MSLLLGLVVGAGPLGAQEDSAGPMAAAIRGVISQQLDAFRRDDGVGAFKFASPGIRQQFGTAEVFMQMVRSAYQPVYRPREVEFRDLQLDGGRIVQRVFLVGPDGNPVIARYYMEPQDDGSWRIGGCLLERAPDQSA
jgi:hypothetical protein